jgi:CRISPR-associated protein Cmr3
VRTRVGLANNGDWARFEQQLIEKIQQIEMVGALLTEIKPEGGPEFFAPTPADSLYVRLEPEMERNPEKNNLFPLVPLKKEDCLSNLPNDLHLLGVTEEVQGKPIGDVKFWNWKTFEQWLIEAKAQKVTTEQLGIGGLIPDRRTHVKIDYERKSNIEGGLFQTRGLEFTTNDRKRLVLTFQVDYRVDLAKKLEPGWFPLGGERRIVRWEKRDFEFPKCPPGVVSRIKETECCRLILLTPAYFENGFLPKSGFPDADIKAVAVDRPIVVSGWDFEKRKPKPTRRLAPAGTVYFLKLTGNVEEWINNYWLNNVGDSQQSKRDGFGLAALGNWDGKIENEV